MESNFVEPHGRAMASIAGATRPPTDTPANTPASLPQRIAPD